MVLVVVVVVVVVVIVTVVVVVGRGFPHGSIFLPISVWLSGEVTDL